MQHNPSFLDLVTRIRQQITECNISDVLAWQQQQKPILLIDTREDNEWQQGYIPEAVHLGKGIIERDIESLCPDKTQMIVLYCGGGYRSALAAHALQLMGYEQVISMDGGFRGWKEKGLPVANAC